MNDCWAEEKEGHVLDKYMGNRP